MGWRQGTIRQLRSGVRVVSCTTVVEEQRIQQTQELTPCLAPSPSLVVTATRSAAEFGIRHFLYSCYSSGPLVIRPCAQIYVPNSSCNHTGRELHHCLGDEQCHSDHSSTHFWHSSRLFGHLADYFRRRQEGRLLADCNPFNYCKDPQWFWRRHHFFHCNFFTLCAFIFHLTFLARCQCILERSHQSIEGNSGNYKSALSKLFWWSCEVAED